MNNYLDQKIDQINMECFPCYWLSQEFIELDKERDHYLTKMSETKPEVEHGYYFYPCSKIDPKFCEGDKECIRWQDQADRVASELSKRNMCTARSWHPCSLQNFMTWYSDRILCCASSGTYQRERDKKISEIRGKTFSNS